jgi:hypothetical protein
MASLKDISNRAIREMIGCFTISKVTPAATTGAATFKTTQSKAGTWQPVIDGVTGPLIANKTVTVLLAKSDLQNPITGLDGFYVQPAATTVYYLLVTNLAGTCYCIQGNYTGRVITGRTGRSGLGVSELPDIAVPATYAPFGAFKCITGTSGFTVGTTFLDATTDGMAFTWTSLNRMGETLPAFA